MADFKQGETSDNPQAARDRKIAEVLRMLSREVPPALPVSSDEGKPVQNSWAEPYHEV